MLLLWLLVCYGTGVASLEPSTITLTDGVQGHSVPVVLVPDVHVSPGLQQKHDVTKMALLLLGIKSFVGFWGVVKV